METNELFRVLFPELLPDKSCVWSAESLQLKRTQALDASTFESAGIGTQVTGRHYDIIIEDDTVAPDVSEMGELNVCPTREGVEQAIGWHRLANPLLVNPSQSQIVVVGTRWFEKDLLSWIEEKEPYYISYERACRERDGKPSAEGEITYPERFNESVLRELEVALGPYMFSCLYLNRPLRSVDMIFKPEWFSYYETPPLSLITYTTVDPGGDPQDTIGEADYNVVVTAGKDVQTGNVYVLEYFHKRCSPGEVINVIFDHARKYSPVKVGVEVVAYQKSLKYWIRERMRLLGEYFLIEAITSTRRSKGAKILGLQPIMASGQLFVRSYMSELMSEFLAFPLGAHDDIIDALSMQLEMWRATVLVDKAVRLPPSDDPLDVQSAIEELEIKAHRRPTARPSVMDVYDYANGLTFM